MLQLLLHIFYLDSQLLVVAAAVAAAAVVACH
jgi:hypothetical protein